MICDNVALVWTCDIKDVILAVVAQPSVVSGLLSFCKRLCDLAIWAPMLNRNVQATEAAKPIPAPLRLEIDCHIKKEGKSIVCVSEELTVALA